MEITTDGLVCGLIAHGEHGAIVRILTPDHGMVAAYVRGGRGRRMRPVLIPGNVVTAQLRWRTEAQLPQAAIELVHSRAPMLSEPLAAAAIEWTTVLLSAALAERQPYPRLYEVATGLLDAVEAAPSASGWGGAMAAFERLVSSQLGYGLPGAATGPVERGDWPAILESLEQSGDHLFGEVLTGRTASLGASRSRLIDRLRRIAG